MVSISSPDATFPRDQSGCRAIRRHRQATAPRTRLDEHLARHALADLFLDTLPYNAHTTASDALNMGVPVLTTPGETFASRVAASQLRTAGLSELIVPSLAEYEALALKLARDPDALGTVRAKLEKAHETAPLFDTARYTRHLEAAFTQMVERFRQGAMPGPITVAPLAS